MKKSRIGAGALVLVGLASAPAFAVSGLLSEGFESVSTALNSEPNGWVSLKGEVDSIALDANNHFGVGGIPLACAGGSHGCVDLDGSSGTAGVFATEGVFTLEAGKTYQLSAEVSGNQRNAGPDSLQFGFLSQLSKPLDNVITSKTISNIAADSPFTLYSLAFNATQTEAVHLFFYNLLGGDNQGLILDNVSLTAVPLPPAAWLFLSGLIALGAVARRRRANDGHTGALAA